MSADFGLGSVSPYEGIGSVAIGEVEHVQGEGCEPVTNTWDVKIDIPAEEMTSSAMEAQPGDDWEKSWANSSEVDRSHSTKIAPPTPNFELRSNASAKATARGNLTATSSARPPRLGQPVILDRPARLARPPATRLVSGLKWLLTPKAYSRILEPLVAQEQHEYFEAIRRGDERLARWIVARLYLLIVCNVVRGLVAPIAKMLRSAN